MSQIVPVNHVFAFCKELVFFASSSFFFFFFFFWQYTYFIYKFQIELKNYNESPSSIQT